MFKKKRFKSMSILAAISIATITSVAAILTGVTYKYNYHRYNVTNNEQVIEISNNSKMQSREAALAPTPSEDGSYYNFSNNSTFSDPKSNDSIDFGPLYNVSNPRENPPYGSRLALSMFSSATEKKAPPFVNFFGVASKMYKFNTESGANVSNGALDTTEVYRYPVGFLTYPELGKEQKLNTIDKNTKYKFAYKSAPYNLSSLSGGLKSHAGGIYKPDLGGNPYNFKNTNDLYGKIPSDISSFKGASFTNARTFDIKGNALSDINIKPNKDAWYYLDTTVGSGIQWGGVFLPQKWEVKDLSSNKIYEYSSSESENFEKLISFNFANYLNKEKTDWQNINSVSMTVTTQYTNTATIGQTQDSLSSLNYLAPNDTSLSYDRELLNITETPDYHKVLNVKNLDFSSSVPSDSRAHEEWHGVKWGSVIGSNVTFSLTPLTYGDNANLIYAPLPYSGTTKSTIKAVIENEDKKFTPIEYATKTLYAKGSQNDQATGEDNDADFRVQLTNGYPGSEYGSINKLFLNNVAGTVRWVYDPGTVLKNGLIQKSTPDDVKELTIGGFKRIPGVTKIADSINVQSPFTLAQDVAKEPEKYYKLVYDLALTNLPNPSDYVDGGTGTWTPNLENLKKIMTITDVTFNNIGEKTSEGYVNGGYLEAYVSLKLYYNEHTNLITPDRNLPTTPKKIRLYGFRHVEPTMIPDKPIYIGDPLITAKQATEGSYQEGIKQSIINGLQKEVTPSAENDFRTTEGGSLPVTNESPDFSKQISLISFAPNNLEGTLTVLVTLNQYFAGASENGALKIEGFTPVEITITGYKKVQQTRLNPIVDVVTDKTADDAVNQNFTSNGIQQYPYIQFLLMKHKADAFVGLPEGFNAGSIQIDSAVANNLEGTVTAQISAFMYYDASGNLIDLTKPSDENAGLGPMPLGQIVMRGFKKVQPTKLKTNVISVAGNLEFYNTLASQVDEVKIASLLFTMKDTILTSYPGLHFSVNSIQILDTYKDNLDGSITVSFALTRYYNNEGKYIEADGESLKEQWLYFDGKKNPNIKILGLTQVKPTEFVTTSFDQFFTPNVTESNLDSTTTSNTPLNEFKEFLEGKNSSKTQIFGGADTNNPYVVNKGDENVISLKNVERSAWEILQLSSKTIFQVSPNDIASFVLRVLQYAGMENYGISIKSSDIGVRIITNRNSSDVVNSSNLSLIETKDFYKGSLEVEISIKLSDNTWTKKIVFEGAKEQGKNIFNRYIPLPIFTNNSSENESEKNLATTFKETDIEKFIFQNIDQIINGSFNSKIPSGKPINFSNYNISISNILYNNNRGEVTVDLTLDNFYLPSGNLSTNPIESVDGENPPKTMTTTVVFKGFKKQKSTEFAKEIDLESVGAQIPFIVPDMNFNTWSDVTASKFWELMSSEEVVNGGYDKQQFVYDLIMGTGKLWGEPDSPNLNRILLSDAEIPINFSKDNIISYDSASFSNINGRLDLTFKIVNYFDNFGNLELNIPKTITLSIFGFRTTQSSIIAGSSINSSDFTNIYINGSYDTTASLVTSSFILENVLSKTSGLWPPIDGVGENTNNFDFVSKIDPSSVIIISTNNSKGEVKASFRLLEDVNIYDSEGNLFTLSKNYTYNLIITGFESSLLLFVGVSVLIIFILFILIPAIILIIKRSRIKAAARGKVSDLL